MRESNRPRNARIPSNRLDPLYMRWWEGRSYDARLKQCMKVEEALINPKPIPDKC